MVLNAYERLPQIADTDAYLIYNYAPHEATFTLKGIKPTDTVRPPGTTPPTAYSPFCDAAVT